MTDENKAGIRERYQRAANSGGDHDVLGAMGIADKRLTAGYVPTGEGEGYHIPKAKLAVALERFFGGDSRAVHSIVKEMGEMVFSHSWVMRIKISRPGAHDMACAVLAWHRGGTCTSCGGHGYDLIPGTKTLSERECEPCLGQGKIPFDQQFTENGRKPEMAQLARWLLAEVERESGRAAPEAMKALSARMDL